MIGALVLMAAGMASVPPTGTPRSSFDVIRRIDLDDGLSDTHLRSIVQDREGFLWFGTVDGLNRYDGYEIRVYTHEPGNLRSLGSSFVQTLYVDRAGALWIGTMGGGLNRYDPLTEDFVRFQHQAGVPESLGSDEVFSIGEDGAGALWIATAKGLDRMDPSSGRFRHFRHDPEDPTSLSGDNVYAVIQDRRGSLWVGTGRGLDQMVATDDSVRFTHYRRDPEDANSLSHELVNVLYEDQEGGIWIGTWGGGLDRLDPERRTVARYVGRGLTGRLIWSIAGDRDGRLWVGAADGGLHVLHPGSRSFRALGRDPGEPSDLSHDNVVTLYEDREGLLWVGTGGGGVNVLDPNRKPFSSVPVGSEPGADVPSLDVRAIEEDRSGTLWVGTFGDGLFAVDEERERSRHYRLDPDASGSSSDDVVLAIEEGAEGDLWIGTSDGLIRLDRATGGFRRYRHDPSNSRSLGDFVVLSILEDRDRGVIWIGTSKGLEHLDLRTERFTRHRDSDPGDKSHHVYAIRRGGEGDLWLARSHGLDRFEPETGRFRHYPLAMGGSASQTAVWAVHLAEPARLWLGTSSGLLLFDAETGGLTQYVDRSGEPIGTVTAILEDDEGRLWLGRTRGLSRFDPETEEFRHYASAETDRRLSFSGAALESRRGRFLFGAADGLTAFFPSRIRESAYAPPVVLTDFEIANRPVPIAAGTLLSQSITETARLELHTPDRFVSFVFAALSYRAPERNRYRYRLEGFDENWTEVDAARRRVTYTNLPPGDYVFRVKGSNNDGLWNEEGAALRVEVLPSWWQTSWFRWGGATLAALALFAAHRFRIAVLREREERNRSVLESLKSHIALLDREGRITAANESWFQFTGASGNGSSSPVGRDYLGTLRAAAEAGDRTAEEALSGIESVLQGASESFDLEYARAASSGTESYSIAVVPFLGREGGVVVSYTDITDRRRAEEEAQKRREELAHVARVATMGELAASIAHEINQPLASIVTYANAGRRFLDGGAPATDDVRGALRAIAEQGKRAGDIIRRLRELMKKGRVERELLDVNELLGAVLTMVHGDALSKGVIIRRSFAEGLPPVPGDAVELQQLMLNLVMNAFEAMEGEDGGPREMTVRSWSDDLKTVHIEVTDTGPPVPDETFEKLFQRFFTSKPSGLGIGLSISQSIVEAHGGFLRAERDPERGLTMRVSLPTSSSG